MLKGYWLALFVVGCMSCNSTESGDNQPTAVSDVPAPAYDRYLYQRAQLGQFSGTVLVAHPDTVFEQSYQIPAAPAAMAVGPATRFPIGELNQLLLRAAYFRLAEQERIVLNAAVGDMTVTLPQNTTINYRMLLDHRAGLPEV